MSQRTAQPPGDDDHRLPAVLNVLWAADATVELDAAERAFRALSGAAKLATIRWPTLYRDPGLARLLYPRDDPPPPEILAAAERAGMAGEPRRWTEGAAVAESDVAILAAREFGAIAEGLPAVIATPGGEPPRLAAHGVLTLGLDRIAARRDDVAATPESLAEALLAPPRRLAERRKLNDYLGENIASRAGRFEYEFLLRLIGETARSASGADDAWERAAKVNAAASVDRGATLIWLRAEYQRADALAVAYGMRWRSTLAARSFLLFGANVASGFVGALLPALSPVTIPVQFGVTALLYLDQFISRRRRWRGKWIGYRRAAEATRIARYCVLAGAPLARSTPPSWIDWRLERIVRRGEPAAELSDADAAAFLAYLCEVEIGRQVAYHREAYRRFRRLDAHLRQAAKIALLATVTLGAVLVVVAVAGVLPQKTPVLGAIGLALSAAPGLYAALNGLRGQLDVERQAERAARVGSALRRLRRALERAEPSVALARAAATSAATIMLEDVSSWDRVMEIV